MQESISKPAPPIPQWLRGQMDDPEYQVIIRRPDGSEWRTNPGPQTWAALCPYGEQLLGGQRGGGKAQSEDSKVLTPFGFIRMGDVKVGTQVCNPDGTVARVIAIHPQGEQPLYDITFTDGATTKITGDHLWLAKETCRQQKAVRRYFPFENDDKSSFKIYTTLGLRALLEKETAFTTNLLIPLAEEVQFTHAYISSHGHPVEPYVLGLLLGDGCLRNKNSIGFTTADQETIDSLRARTGITFKENGRFGYRSIGDKKLIAKLEALGAYGDLAHDKCIPESYRLGPIDVRRDVIRGLMDTDGYVDSRGHCSFTSTSIELAKDVQWICRSLGYKATLTTGSAGYKNPDGVFIQCRDAHTVYIQGKRTSELFSLRRKKNRCRETFNGGVSIPCRRITSIKECASGLARCITVDHPNGLYITDDFIVTHNSKLLIALPAMGDLSLPLDDPARYSFLNDQSFRGLLLREEYQSMEEFVDEAVEFYKPFGGKPAGKPTSITFPKTGAKIYFNHLGDEDAFNKYKGWNLTFIGIEELTLIATLKRYLKLLGSLRSAARTREVRDFETKKMVFKKFPELRTKIVSTTNPDGPGASWVKARFVELMGKNGLMIPRNTPMRDPVTGAFRIFIPFGLDDNPYYGKDTAAGVNYRQRLMAQDETTRKQWLEGDWNAGTSTFFESYRPNGPVGENEQRDFPWARHIVAPQPIQPWWYRWGSGDWGYNHPGAFHKAVRNESDKRVHIYDELVVRQMGSFEVGATLAQWWMDDLIALRNAGQEPCITIYMGADVFSKDDDQKTKAQRMEAGIKEILGPFGALLLKYDENEQQVMLRDPKRAKAMLDERKRQIAGHLCMVLKPIYFNRVDAWDYVRDMIRFRPVLNGFQTAEDREAYLKQVLKEEGFEAYERHAADLRKIKPEVLPKVLIWNKCKGLDRCLRSAQKDMRNDDDPAKPSKREDVLKRNADTEGKNGDDELEAGRNAIIAFKEVQTMMPMSYFVNEQVTAAKESHVKDFGTELDDPTRLAMIAMRQQSRYGAMVGTGPKVLNLPRASSSRHRAN